MPAGRNPVTARRAAPRRKPAGPVAFYDFDNTLIDGDAGPLFGWYLFHTRRRNERRFWQRMRIWARFLPYLSWMGVQGLLYRLRFRRRSSILRAAYKGLRGIDAAMFYGLMDDFARTSIVPRILPAMRADIREHLAAGHRCVVVTTGMEVLVRPVLDAIDPSIDLIGCRMRERRGRLTGSVDGPLFGLDKANIMDAYCRALGVDMAACWAYSDHWSDRKMLEAVGNAVAVNPRRRLRRLAESEGWAVLEAPPADPRRPSS